MEQNILNLFHALPELFLISWNVWKYYSSGTKYLIVQISCNILNYVWATFIYFIQFFQTFILF